MNESNEINEEEVFEKKESKIKPKLKKIFSNKKIVVAVIIVLVVAIVGILEFTTGAISNLIYINAGMGNSVGNIVNCGYSVAKDDYIYYVAPGENMETTNIYRAKIGTSDSEQIFSGSYDIRALNVIGNKIYFINISTENAPDDDMVDNKIYKMNLDGSEPTIINDNEFAYDYYDMYIVNNKIYYVGTDYNVYKMDLNGGNRELVAETGTGYLAINEKYIIYNKENDDQSDYITYIRSLNGTDERAINSSRIYTPNIYGDYIYYINNDEVLAKAPVAGGEEEVILQNTVYNMNVSNGNIYYLNYKDEANEDYTVCIYKLSVDGGEPQVIKELSYYASFLNVVDDYVYYMDMNEEKSFINLVNVNDSSEIQLYEWKLEELTHNHNEETEDSHEHDEAAEGSTTEVSNEE